MWTDCSHVIVTVSFSIATLLANLIDRIKKFMSHMNKSLRLSPATEVNSSDGDYKIET